MIPLFDKPIWRNSSLINLGCMQLPRSLKYGWKLVKLRTGCIGKKCFWRAHIYRIQEIEIGLRAFCPFKLKKQARIKGFLVRVFCAFFLMGYFLLQGGTQERKWASKKMLFPILHSTAAIVYVFFSHLVFCEQDFRISGLFSIFSPHLLAQAKNAWKCINSCLGIQRLLSASVRAIFAQLKEEKSEIMS